MSARRGERGTVTIWVLGLTVAIMFLGGLGLDFWRAIAVRRELSTMADAAATAGANGLDESALRGDELQLDDTRVRVLVAGELAQYSDAARLTGEELAVDGTNVTLTLHEVVHFSLLGIFMPGGHFEVAATAVAAPREVP